MIWVQALSMFVLWTAYGVVQARRSSEVRRFAESRRPQTRGLVAAALMLSAIAVLFGGLQIVWLLGGFTERGMAPWAWIAATLIGLAFVHLQTLALAIAVVMVHRTVTPHPDSASTTKEPTN